MSLVFLETFFSIFILLLFIDQVKNTNYFLFFFVTLFAIIITLRCPIEHDTKIYIDYFKNLDLSKIINHKIRFEYGFQILVYFSKLFFGGIYHLFLFLIVILFVAFTNSAAKNIGSLINVEFNRKQNAFIFNLLILSYFGVFYTAITIRAAIALSLTVLSISYSLNEKGIFKVVFLLVIATLIHATAGFCGCLSLLIIKLPTISKKCYFYFGLLIFLLYITNIGSHLLVFIVTNRLVVDSLSLINSFLAKRIWYYVTNIIASTPYGVSSKYLVFMFKYFLIIHFYDETKNEAKLINLFLFGMVILMGGRFIPQIERVSDYFVIYGEFLFWKILVTKRQLLHSTLLYYCLFAIILMQVAFSVNIFNMSLLGKF